MNFIDFHADTLNHLFYADGAARGTLWENELQVDIQRMRQSGYTAQIFACFLNLENAPRLGSHYADVLGMADLLHEQLCGHTDVIRFAGSYRDYAENRAAGVASAFLSLEEGGVLENRIERLDELYRSGIRVMNLTWNHENCLAYPHKTSALCDKGLKPFGLEALDKMNTLGIIADVSHLSDGGFYDVLLHSRRPVMATHSNARAVHGVSRNLTDAMIRQLAEKGGIIGLNFYADFLAEGSISRVSDMLRHCRHMINVGGEAVLGIGSDFDGIDCALELPGAHAMPHLAAAMLADGFPERLIERICYKNAEDFFCRYWGA